MLNALSVDVEDWFQVGAFENVIARDAWDGLEQRVERNADAVLALFDEAGVKATFFTLGWVAERYPALIRRIAEAGHEIASHGWDHKRVFTMSAAEFRADLERARIAIEDACGQSPAGYRAPSFSIDSARPGRTGARRGRLCLFLERRADPPRPLWLARSAALRLPAAPGSD
jgi:polysaccharide deacetylase family protein (PEP-CTERM system associated)